MWNLKTISFSFFSSFSPPPSSRSSPLAVSLFSPPRGHAHRPYLRRSTPASPPLCPSRASLPSRPSRRLQRPSRALPPLHQPCRLCADLAPPPPPPPPRCVGRRAIPGLARHCMYQSIMPERGPKHDTGTQAVPAKLSYSVGCVAHGPDQHCHVSGQPS